MACIVSSCISSIAEGSCSPGIAIFLYFMVLSVYKIEVSTLTHHGVCINYKMSTYVLCNSLCELLLYGSLRL